MTTITTPNGVTHPVELVTALNLGRDSRTIITDPPSGNPYISQRPATTARGSASLLVRGYATAKAIVDGFATAGPATLTLLQARDVRTNLLRDPQLTTATWTQNGSTGTFTHPTVDGPNGHGYFQYVMDTANTTSPMSVALAPTGLGAIPVVPGAPLIVSAYWWQALNQNIQRYSMTWYDVAGASISSEQGEDEIVPGEPTSTWYRESHVFTPPALARFGRPSMVWSGSYNPQTLRVADALVEYGTVLRPWFSGAFAPAGYTASWTGAANASTSQALTAGGVADSLTFQLSGTAQLANDQAGMWTVQVPFTSPV